MGIQTSPSGQRGRLFKRRRKGFVSEINVTPFVDVMLVLLIVFMITAPLLSVGVPVDLPESSAPAFSNPNEPLVITISSKGVLYIEKTKISNKNMISHLETAAKYNKNVRVFIRAHKNLRYSKVVAVMGDITAAGFTKVALITDNKR